MIKPCPTCSNAHDPANECRVQRMTCGDRLKMLADAQHGMTRDQRQNFEQLFIGALSVDADDERWQDCLETAAAQQRLPDLELK